MCFMFMIISPKLCDPDLKSISQCHHKQVSVTVMHPINNIQLDRNKSGGCQGRRTSTCIYQPCPLFFFTSCLRQKQLFDILSFNSMGLTSRSCGNPVHWPLLNYSPKELCHECWPASSNKTYKPKCSSMCSVNVI